MRTKDNLKLMEEITILNQFLYMDENNYVEFKNGDFIRVLIEQLKEQKSLMKNTNFKSRWEEIKNITMGNLANNFFKI